MTTTTWTPDPEQADALDAMRELREINAPWSDRDLTADEARVARQNDRI